MSDELAHAHASVEEWTFEWWSAEFAGVALYRLVERAEAWYGWALGDPVNPWCTSSSTEFADATIR